MKEGLGNLLDMVGEGRSQDNFQLTSREGRWCQSSCGGGGKAPAWPCPGGGLTSVVDVWRLKHPRDLKTEERGQHFPVLGAHDGQNELRAFSI